MMQRSKRVLLAVVIVCTLAGAVTVPAYMLSKSDPMPELLPSTTTAPPIPTLVAIGDSYTAGPGVLPYQENSIADQCFRSNAAYPIRAAESLRIPGKSVACSGATTEAFTAPYKGEAPQLEGLVDADIVVLSIGGNDARALQTLAEDPVGAASPSFMAEFEKNNLAPLRGKLVTAYGAIRAKAPDADVFVVGYPTVFPADRSRFQYCAGLQLPLGPAAFTLPVENLYLLNLKLNDVVRATAADAGFTYVDVAPWFKDRDVCSDLRLIWGTADAPNQEGIMHPTGDGHRVMADVLAGTIRNSGISGLPPPQ